MYPKAINTLSGLATAAGILMLSYALGEPPRISTGPGAITLAGSHLIVIEDGGNAEVTASPVVSGRKPGHGLKRQIAMPYFSFGQLLPHRES